MPAYSQDGGRSGGGGLMAALGPGWELEVDSATPGSWAEMLDLFTDANIYQTWAYGAVRWGSRNLSHIVLRRSGDVRAIAQLRIIRPMGLKFGMAYLRWGPMWERRGRPLDGEALEQMSRALEAEYVKKRGLLLQVLPNAFSGSERAAMMESAFSRYARKRLATAEAYRTLVVDLAPTVEELRKKLDKKWRNQLSRAERNGLEVIEGRGIAEFAIFRRMYQEMRERKRFESTVSIEDFAHMQNDLTDSQRLQVLICQERGVPVAGLVASAMGDSAVYLLGATSDSGLQAKGAYLLQWTLILRLKERGCRWYDLGGIDPERNPGVYHFKRGLLGTEAVQETPFAACNSPLSAAAVHFSVATQRSMRWLAGMFEARPVKDAVERASA